MTITSAVALARDPAVVDALNSRPDFETRDLADFEVRFILLRIPPLVTDPFGQIGWSIHKARL